MNICIVGATGNVGRKILDVLEKKNFSIDELYLVASERSVGKKISFKKKEYTILNLEEFDFSKCDITFFSAGGEIAKKFAEKAAKHSTVIDNSSFFRMDPDVPLIVPQVNAADIKNIKKNIIANANCSTIQMVLALNPLHEVFKIKRIVVSTYQSVSGAGKDPMDELIDQTKLALDKKKIESKNFTKQIAFNAIPHIDVFSDNGYTNEEIKMINETKKILDKDINVTATCVRVPVLVSHAESVNVEFEKEFTLEKVIDLLNTAEGCKVINDQRDGGYITQLEAEGKYETFISRVRKDNTNEKAINLWIVSDNLLRGAALNAVEIAEAYIKTKK
jgi:aspartate-semialdehyde dehydrogenase